MHRAYRAPVQERLDAIAGQGSSPRRHITILGAGMAGLVAARELSTCGHEVEILEATNRVGGRVHTWRPTASDQYHEFGAMRIPHSHNFTRHYVSTAGLELQPFITVHQDHDAWFHLRGKTFQMKDSGAFVPRLYELSLTDRSAIEKITRDVAEDRRDTVAVLLMSQVLGPTLAALSPEDERALLLEGQPTALSTKLESMSLGQLVAQTVRGPEAAELVGAVTGLDVWWHIAVAPFIREEFLKDGAPFDEIVGGTDLLPQQLSAKPMFELERGAAVTGIAIKPDGHVSLTVKDTEGPYGQDTYPSIKPGAPARRIECPDLVLCTIPFSVLRGMDLTGFSASKMAAIRMMNYASAAKVLLLCQQRRWESQEIVGGASMSDSIVRHTYYPSDHRDNNTLQSPFESMYRIRHPLRKESTDHIAKPSEPGVLVASYNWGRDARRMSSIPHAQRVETCLHVLEKLHPGISGDVIESASACWDNNPWTRGAFSWPCPNETPQHFENGRRPEGQLFFAGEHLSFNPGWMQGAIISALDASEAMLATRPPIA